MSNIEHAGLIDFSISPGGGDWKLQRLWIHITSNSAIQIEDDNWIFILECREPLSMHIHIPLGKPNTEL